MDRVLAWLRKPWLQLALVLLVATAFRVWAIDKAPPGLFGDEAAEGLDALDVLAGRGQVFFPTNYGREGLHIWLVAGSIKLFGVTPLATRLPAVILGILTCGLAWWMAREMARPKEPARRPATPHDAALPGASDFLPLVAGLFLATAFWHVLFSRFSQRTILTPFAIALCVAAFWRGVNTGRLKWFAVGGAGMGLALHSYSVGRFFPLFMGLFLLVQVLVRQGPARSLLAQHWRGILVMYAVAGIIFAPLAYYFVTHPGSFLQRATAVATYAGGTAADTLAVIGRAALANLAQYVVPGAGDKAQFHNLPGRPVFDLISAVFAVAGLVVCTRRWRAPAALFLLGWVAVMTLPAALATDRFPTLPRVLGVLPGLYLFPSIGVAWLAGRIARRSPTTLVMMMLVVVAAAGAVTFRDYFQRWARSAETFFAFEGDMTAAVDWIARHNPEGHVYLSSDIYRHPTYMYLAERATVTGYFEHTNPRLSWFDARHALPLPVPGVPATYVISTSAPPGGPGAQALTAAEKIDEAPAPDGTPALLVYRDAATLSASGGGGGTVLFSRDALTLVHATWSTAPGGRPLLVLTWRSDRAIPGDWGGYRLRVTAGDRSVEARFDAFRAPEWVEGGEFVTWHEIDWPDRPAGLAFSIE